MNNVLSRPSLLLRFTRWPILRRRGWKASPTSLFDDPGCKLQSMAITGLDHIIYATPDLDESIAALKALTGVEPAYGGSHTGRGTRNALLSLGPDTYIEVLAPDPAQSPEALALAANRIPASARITTWAAKCSDLDAALRVAAGMDLDLGHIEAMSRALPSGGRLDWRLTRGASPGDGLVPFLIDWETAAHPAPAAPAGCALRFFRAEHPEPDRVRGYLAGLGLRDVLEVSEGAVPRLIAELSTPNGDVVLE